MPLTGSKSSVILDIQRWIYKGEYSSGQIRRLKSVADERDAWI
jgi:hypothetical protein